MKNIIGILIILFLVYACEPPVKFEKSQPEGINAEMTFKGDYLGKYVNEEDKSLFLTIDPQKIILESDYQRKNHFNDLDTSELRNMNAKIDLKNRQQIVQTLQAEGYKTLIKGDTIEMKRYHCDTLFQISQNAELKYADKTYFLNFKNPSDNTWEVKVLALNQRKHLTLADVTEPSNLKNLEGITGYKAIKDDSGKVVKYSINPSPQELKKLIRKKGVLENDKFLKIK